MRKWRSCSAPGGRRRLASNPYATLHATHIITHTHRAARSTYRNTHIRPEGVAWAAMSYAGPRTSTPSLFGGNGVCGTRSGTEPPSPEEEAWAALSFAGPRTSSLFGGNGVCGTWSGTDLPPPSTQRHHAQCCTDHSLSTYHNGRWRGMAQGLFGEAACGDIHTASEAVTDTTLGTMALPAVRAYLDSIGLSDPDQDSASGGGRSTPSEGSLSHKTTGSSEATTSS